VSEKYTGTADDRRYTSEAVDVTYSVKRCIHAAECVSRLHEVFDTQKRPWIQPGKSTGDAVVGVVSLCPSGALHTERNDGGAGETMPAENVIIVHEDSYYQFRGDLAVQGSNVAIEREVRAALCRCGMSGNKPFCDNSHKKGFEAPATTVEIDRQITAETGGKLLVTLHENGPIEVNGNFELRDEKGNTIHRGSSTWLCRCGHSTKKPFCTGTHKHVAFETP
jgi:CDGSH-type Zn-finger protein/uncharacterized Fe-S cluster protein YjdI